MKFELINYKYDRNDINYINFTYKIVGSSGMLDIQVNDNDELQFKELFIQAISKLYRTDEFIVFYKNLMFKCYKGYYQVFRRY